MMPNCQGMYCSCTTSLSCHLKMWYTCFSSTIQHLLKFTQLLLDHRNYQGNNQKGFKKVWWIQVLDRMEMYIKVPPSSTSAHWLSNWIFCTQNQFLRSSICLLNRKGTRLLVVSIMGGTYKFNATCRQKHQLNAAIFQNKNDVTSTYFQCCILLIHCWFCWISKQQYPIYQNYFTIWPNCSQAIEEFICSNNYFSSKQDTQIILSIFIFLCSYVLFVLHIH